MLTQRHLSDWTIRLHRGWIKRFSRERIIKSSSDELLKCNMTLPLLPYESLAALLQMKPVIKSSAAARPLSFPVYHSATLQTFTFHLQTYSVKHTTPMHAADLLV